MEIYVTSKFKKEFRKLSKEIQKVTLKKQLMFQANPFGPKLKTHKLKGVLKDKWAFSVNYKYRIAFEFINQNTILFHSIGTHKIYE